MSTIGVDELQFVPAAFSRNRRRVFAIHCIDSVSNMSYSASTAGVTAQDSYEIVMLER
jgi:hypothetical protein